MTFSGNGVKKRTGRRNSLLLVAVVVLMAPTVQADEAKVTVDAKMVKDTLSPFEPFLVEVTIKNESSRSLVLQDTAVLPFIMGNPPRPRTVFRYHCRFGWVEAHIWPLLPEDYKPRFLLLRPGQYVRRVIDLSCRKGGKGDREDESGMFIRLYHKIEIPQENEAAERFANAHGAVVLNCVVDSQPLKVHYVPPRNNVEESMFAFTDRCLKGDDVRGTHFATWAEAAPLRLRKFAEVHPIWDYALSLIHI